MADEQEKVESLAGMFNEINMIVSKFGSRVNEPHGSAEMAALLREQDVALTDALRKHRRIVDFMEGKPVEPEAHIGEAVLLPVGGLG